MTENKKTRELSEFELDTLIKIRYPAGLIERGLLSELLENPVLFRDLTAKFIERKKAQINNLKTQKNCVKASQTLETF